MECLFLGHSRPIGAHWKSTATLTRADVMVKRCGVTRSAEQHHIVLGLNFSILYHILIKGIECLRCERPKRRYTTRPLAYW